MLEYIYILSYIYMVPPQDLPFYIFCWYLQQILHILRLHFWLNFWGYHIYIYSILYAKLYFMQFSQKPCNRPTLQSLLDWRLKIEDWSFKKLLQSRSSIFNPGLKKFFSELQSSIFNLQSWIEEVFLRSSIFNLQSSKLCKVCKFWLQRSRPNEAWKVTSDTKP